METKRLWAVLATCTLIALPMFGPSPAAHATLFTPVLDEFWIVKDGTEIFRDTFGDGTVPPSGPDGPVTYILQGGSGFTSEAGGKLTMTPSLGDPTLITGVFSDLFTGATRAASLDPASAAFLGAGDSFSIHGLYDLSSLPEIVGQLFGIRATDRTSTNAGDDVIQLNVQKSLTDQLIVRLAEVNFVADTITTLAVFPIEGFIGTADQIELILSKAALSDVVTASFILYDRDIANPLDQDILTQSLASSSSLLEIYNGETFTRAQFFSTDRIFVPEPPGLAMFGLGLMALRFLRRRRAG